MKKKKLYEFPIDHPLTAKKRSLLEKSIEDRKSLSDKPVTYQWSEADDTLLISADPVEIDVVFHATSVELLVAAPVWARALLTQKKKTEIKSLVETVLVEAKLIGNDEHAETIPPQNEDEEKSSLIVVPEQVQLAPLSSPSEEKELGAEKKAGAEWVSANIQVIPQRSGDKPTEAITPQNEDVEEDSPIVAPEQGHEEIAPHAPAPLVKEDAAREKAVSLRPVLSSASIRVIPQRNGIAIWSPALFSDLESPHLQSFLSRIFKLQDIATVELHPAKSLGWIGFKTTKDIPSILRQLGGLLRAPHSSIFKHSDLSADSSDVETQHLRLTGFLDGPVRIHRFGRVLSTWQVRSQGLGHLRLAHPVLRLRRDIAFRLEQELATIPGIKTFTTSTLNSSIAVQFDPRTLTPERLILRLERAWPWLLEGLDGPPSSKRLVAAGGLLGLAFTGQFLVPAIRPIALLAVFIYSGPNVINGARQLGRGQIGLYALYTTGLMLTMLSGMPFSSALMAVLMQTWPQLTHRTLNQTQQRLFGRVRQRPTWVRLLTAQGDEKEIDIDLIRAGDIILVRKGESIPVDGTVTKGLAAVDEEVFSKGTGIADKAPGDSVYAASVIIDGQLTLRVDKVGADTVAGHIAAALPRATIEMLPATVEAERIANRNAKPTLALEGLSLLLTRRLRPSQAIIRPDYATGSRMSAQFNALRDLADGLQHGILFRDPTAVDRLSGAEIYVLDESAALERRSIKVAEVLPNGIVSANTLLGYAAAAFARSGEERAKALIAQTIKSRIAFPKVIGHEHRAGVVRYQDSDNRLVEVANPGHISLRELKIPSHIAEVLARSHSAAPDRIRNDDQVISHEDPSLRPLFVLRGGALLGVITFLREGASQSFDIVAALKARNKKARFLYLSSDSQAAADSVAGQAGISSAYGDLDPIGKSRMLKALGSRAMWIGNGASEQAVDSVNACSVSVSTGGLATCADDLADIVFLQPGLQNLEPLIRIGEVHHRSIEADYRVLYAANLLGVLGGLLTGFSNPQSLGAAGRFVAGFSSLEAGLLSNLGTGFIYATHRKQLNDLVAKAEAKTARRPITLRYEVAQKGVGQKSQPDER